MWKNPRPGFKKTFKTAAELQRLATTGGIAWSQEDWSQQERIARRKAEAAKQGGPSFASAATRRACISATSCAHRL